MAKHKVIWEERRYAIVEADSPEEAEEMVSKGEFDEDFSEEITMSPQAIDIIPD